METYLKSYELHSKTYKDIDKNKAQKWVNEDTVDYWRHNRMYNTLLPILNNYPNANWLTIGDGRYGTEAHYVLKYTSNVLATDIAEDCLKAAKEEGFITNYKIENAENLTFENNTFDFTLVKEAYHHFPRPIIALYEMLRVSKKGIILIEPNDQNCTSPQKFSINESLFWLKNSIKSRIKNLLGRERYYEQGNYEPSGNYVYTISVREIEKIALGLNYDLIAFKGLNDHYINGVEFELCSDNGPLFKEVKKVIKEQDRDVEKGKRVCGLLTAFIFKEMPNNACIQQMEKDGFKIIKLNKNPYL